MPYYLIEFARDGLGYARWTFAANEKEARKQFSNRYPASAVELHAVHKLELAAVQTYVPALDNPTA